MFNIYDSTVNSFYLAFYGRPADPAGLKFWSKALADNNGDAGAIIGAFANSQEAQTRFGSDTVSARITDIYEQLFNRAPDAAGLDFWTKAVEQGNATLAEVSLAILKGAQSSDLDLSTMRQKAADAFTAAVEDGSTEYSGYASIEAARVLVRAVTADATEADLTTLVKAAVSFADTATKTPRVVEAIATGSTLLNLYDTARGTKDPVALTQALADTAKAAAGDPVTLESLLRGGGMDKVLKVMPTKATLTDVVEALAKGGLPAAVDVVYPPAKPVPAPAPSAPMELKFDSVSQGPFDTNKKDNVTNVEVATVKFSYTGSDLKTGQGFQYSIDGVNWTSKNVSADPLTKMVTIKGVQLTGQNTSVPGNSESSIQTPLHPIGNVITTVQVRAVDAAKNVIADAAGKIEYDGTPPGGFVEYKGIVYGNSCTLTDPVATFQKIAILDHDIIQWHIEGAADWIDVKKFNEDGSFSLQGLDLGKGDQKVELRVIDAAGNVGFEDARLIEGQGVHQPSLSFTVTPSIGGLVVDSNFAGTLQLLDSGKAQAIKSIDGISTANIGITTIGVQDAVARGTFQIKPADAAAVKDGNVYDYVYSLGTGKADTISGQAVWGFDGDDDLTATDNGAYLFGGNGNDTLTAGAGPDTIVGGKGADKIYLGKDDFRDIVYYELGDAAGDVFADGGSIAGMDVINGFDDLDRIEFANNNTKASTSAGSSYLSNSASNGVAVVRGSDEGGVFKAGSDASDDDFMVQWSDGAQINSVIVHNYGAFAPMVSVQQLNGPLGQSTGISFGKPLTAKYLAMDTSLAGNPSILHLFSDFGPVTALASQAGLTLTNLSSGIPVPAQNHVDPANVMYGNIYLNGKFKTGLYELNWDDGTFIAGNRVLEAGKQLFAGGKDGQIAHDGIVLAGQSYVHGVVERGNEKQENHAFISDGTANAYIHTGGGNDVIVDNGTELTIAYSSFESGAHDLILGFDKADDAIQISGAAAAMLDKGVKNGHLDWLPAAQGLIDADTEGVYLTAENLMVFGTGSMETTAGTLRNALDVSAIATGDSLLILAGSNVGDGGALLLYTNRDGNGFVDALDLTTIAVFGDGVAGHDDIDLVGLQNNSFPPP